MQEKYLSRLVNEIPRYQEMSSFSVPWNLLWEWAIKIGLVIIAVLVGIAIAKALGRITRQALQRTKIDKVFEVLGWDKQLEKIGFTVPLSAVVGWMVKWFIILAIFSRVINYLKLYVIADFLNDIVYYIPKVLVAAVILALGFFLAKTVRKVLSPVMEGASGNDLPAQVAYYAIATVTVLVVVDHLGIGGRMAEILFAGLVVGMSLAFGIAFGLGGKEKAAEILGKIGKKKE